MSALTANQLLGGKPTLLYFNVAGTQGRGEVVRLMFHEAGIEFEDKRIEFSEWGQMKPQITADVNPVGSLPIVQLNGRNLAQSVPILRYIAKKLGKYHGSNDDQELFIDQFTDIYIDWRASWVTSLSGQPAHAKENAPRYHKVFEKLLASYGGPFVIGGEFSYADVCLYQVLNDDGLLANNKAALAELPNLKRFSDAVEARPRIAKYLEFRKQYLPK
eukprot:jgi/Hompol1/6872/HPOL_002359-RA